MSNTLSEFVAGAIFGSALLTSGVYAPSVIVSQMRLTNFHMLKVFLGASACSAAVVAVGDKTGYAPCRIRAPSSYGWFPFDANLIGGLFIGSGMALTGACPGTVLVQVAAGVKSGIYVGLGSLLGGILYTKVSPYLKRRQESDKKLPGSTNASSTSAAGSNNSKGHTIQSKFNISTANVLLTYEMMCLVSIVVANHFAEEHPGHPNPILGGVIIGAAQAAAVLISRHTVGVSTAFQDLGRRFWRAANEESFPSAKLLTPAVTFALGILGGTTVLARSKYVRFTFETLQIPDAMAVAGGAAMVFGAGLAGGCPSGHGISGMATFSLSSFVSVAAMFGGGIATAMLFK